MARKRRPPPFYALDAELPLVLAIASGLQHALAMLAGLITPPIIFASTLNLDSKTSSYLISASLIGCGMFSSPSVSYVNTQLYYRHTELGSDVPDEAFRRILSWYGAYFCRRNEFCNSKHRKRCMSCASPS